MNAAGAIYAFAGVAVLTLAATHFVVFDGKQLRAALVVTAIVMAGFALTAVTLLLRWQPITPVASFATFLVATRYARRVRIPGL